MEDNQMREALMKLSPHKVEQDEAVRTLESMGVKVFRLVPGGRVCRIVGTYEQLRTVQYYMTK